MTKKAADEVTDERFPLCLSEIDGFESLIVRMPTAPECELHRLCVDVPVLIIQCKGGKRLFYRADMFRLTVDTAPPPTASEVDEAIRYIADHILEDLGNVFADLARLSAAADKQPKAIVKLADELRQWRADELLDPDASPKPRVTVAFAP